VGSVFVQSVSKQERFERATLFVALVELLGSERQARLAWPRLVDAVDRRSSLAERIRSATGRHDLDAGRVEDATVRARGLMAELGARDRVLELGLTGYPDLLAQTTDAPQFLFVRDPQGLVRRPSIAVVGTASPSAEGYRRAKKLGYLLAKRGIVVVSGLAPGIDEAVHVGALECGGATIAVLATPLNSVNSAQERLQSIIGRAGALVSQFHPGASVEKWGLPMHNTVMSGLAIGTVVVEAPDKNDALIHARRSLQQGRKLFIPQSAMKNTWLKWPSTYLQHQHAHAFASIAELVRVLEREALIPKDVHADTHAMDLVRANAG
jgi:DNA processing protein